jgi:hypothetical protein
MANLATPPSSRTWRPKMGTELQVELRIRARSNRFSSRDLFCVVSYRTVQHNKGQRNVTPVSFLVFAKRRRRVRMGVPMAQVGVPYG